MALPQSLRTSVTPPELELIASEQLIDVVPLVTMEKTAFISVSIFRSNLLLLPEMVRRDNPKGAYGPLRPPAKARVPLWIAVNLKLKKKCHIVPPEWLSVGIVSRSCFF
jgi:GINS complex subunit 2